MNNLYDDEFETEMSIDDFIAWLDENMFNFQQNMHTLEDIHGVRDTRQLWKWMSTFNAWTEFEDYMKDK